MTTDRICYRKGYKYQLYADYALETGIAPGIDVRTDFIHLNEDGRVELKRGYAWDGPSGPALDVPSFMRASLVHDAFYQLMREGFLNQHPYRKLADLLMRDLCREDGMFAPKAWLAYALVRFGAGPAADPAHDRKPIHAPPL